MTRLARLLEGYAANTWFVVNPRLAGRLARGFARALLLRRNTLRAIEIYPTMECNLACPMCSVEKFKRRSGTRLNLEGYRRIARDGARLGALSLTVLGGEPLLAEDLEAIIRIFKARHFYVHIVSNGVLATRQRLARLRAAGLDGVCFSLDSMDPAVNDRIRGLAGHHGRVLAAIDAAQSLGLTVNVAPVFFPGHLDDALGVVRFCQERGIRASGTQVAPVGAWEGGPLLSRAENARIRRLLEEHPRLTFDWAFSYFLKKRCPAGKEKIAIDPFGEVFGCVINPIAYGSIAAEPLRRIHARMQRIPVIRADAPVCIAAEDRDYIDRYLRPLAAFDVYPVPYAEHPAFRCGAGRG